MEDNPINVDKSQEQSLAEQVARKMLAHPVITDEQVIDMNHA